MRFTKEQKEWIKAILEAVALVAFMVMSYLMLCLIGGGY